MLTIEIIAVLALFVVLLSYAMVRTQAQRRQLGVIWEDTRPARILIVDHDADFVKSTKNVLRSQGYEVYVSSRGAEVLDIARSAHARPDLVLLDAMMDYMTDGFDVRGAMRSDPTLRYIPVIAITSLTEARTQETLHTQEHVAVNAWLSKPLQPRVLREAVEETLAGVRTGAPVTVPRVTQTTKQHRGCV